MTKHIALLIGLLVVLVLVFACVWLFRLDWEYIAAAIDGGAHLLPVERSVYTFDPLMVSSTLPTGDFLTPVPEDPNTLLTESLSSVVWDEEMFYAIASRAVEQKGEMRLIDVGFGSLCANGGSGLSGMVFEYTKRSGGTRGLPYLYVRVDVEPNRILYWAYAADAAANEMRRPVVDYAGMRIKALDAIRIAEQNGGSEFRNNVNDACEIHGGLWNGTTWKVWYQEEWGESAALDFYVDTESGEMKAVESR